jgi:hypothetical protein
MIWTIRRILILIVLISFVAVVGTLIWVAASYQRFTAEALNDVTATISENLVLQRINNYHERNIAPFVDEWSRLSTLVNGMIENEPHKAKLAANRTFTTIEVINGLAFQGVGRRYHAATMDQSGFRGQLDLASPWFATIGRPVGRSLVQPRPIGKGPRQPIEGERGAFRRLPPGGFSRLHDGELRQATFQSRLPMREAASVTVAAPFMGAEGGKAGRARSSEQRSTPPARARKNRRPGATRCHRTSDRSTSRSATR